MLSPQEHRDNEGTVSHLCLWWLGTYTTQLFESTEKEALLVFSSLLLGLSALS